jgi:hypothetical protein
VDGFLTWKVTLTKREGLEKYGFSHSSAKVDFMKRRRRTIPQDGSKPGSPVPSDGAGPEQAEEMIGPEMLVVKRISDHSLLFEWNLVHPDQPVKINDRIVRVNGQEGMEAMQQILRDPEQSITLRVLRFLDHFDVTLTKKGKMKLGFKFDKRGDTTNGYAPALKITEVGEVGLMEEANQERIREGRFHLVVVPGMRIEVANEAKDNPDDIANELRTWKEALTLHVRRPDADPPLGGALSAIRAVRMFKKGGTGTKGLTPRSAAGSQDPASPAAALGAAASSGLGGGLLGGLGGARASGGLGGAFGAAAGPRASPAAPSMLGAAAALTPASAAAPSAATIPE